MLIQIVKYNKAPHYEYTTPDGIMVVRKKSNSYINALQLLKIAKVPPKVITSLNKVMVDEFPKLVKYNTGDAKYRGVYIPLDDAKQLAEQHNITDKMKPLFDISPSTMDAEDSAPEDEVLMTKAERKAAIRAQKAEAARIKRAKLKAAKAAQAAKEAKESKESAQYANGYAQSDELDSKKRSFEKLFEQRAYKRVTRHSEPGEIRHQHLDDLSKPLPLPEDLRLARLAALKDEDEEAARKSRKKAKTEAFVPQPEKDGRENAVEKDDDEEDNDEDDDDDDEDEDEEEPKSEEGDDSDEGKDEKQKKKKRGRQPKSEKGSDIHSKNLDIIQALIKGKGKNSNENKKSVSKDTGHKPIGRPKAASSGDASSLKGTMKGLQKSELSLSRLVAKRDNEIKRLMEKIEAYEEELDKEKEKLQKEKEKHQKEKEKMKEKEKARKEKEKNTEESGLVTTSKPKTIREIKIARENASFSSLKDELIEVVSRMEENESKKDSIILELIDQKKQLDEEALQIKYSNSTSEQEKFEVECLEKELSREIEKNEKLIENNPNLKSKFENQIPERSLIGRYKQLMENRHEFEINRLETEIKEKNTIINELSETCMQIDEELENFKLREIEKEKLLKLREEVIDLDNALIRSYKKEAEKYNLLKDQNHIQIPIQNQEI